MNRKNYEKIKKLTYWELIANSKEWINKKDIPKNYIKKYMNLIKMPNLTKHTNIYYNIM